MMLGLSLGLSARRGGGVFDPASLFASGEDGAWYDPSDLSTLFQDAAGTTAVTTDGDPVGRMEDKSGNAVHVTQSTAAARPVYRTNGTLHWLDFDGVDDVLVDADLVSGTSAVSLFAAFNAPSQTTYRNYLGFGAGSTSGGIFSIGASAGIALVARGGSASYAENTDGSAHVYSAFAAANSNISNADLYIDGNLKTTTSTSSQLLNLDNGLGIGAEGRRAGFAECDFYGGVFVVADKTADRAQVEAYLAGKSGVTL